MSGLIATLAALVMLCLTGSAFSQQEASPVREPVRIGATMSITGKAYSVQGGYGREGYLLCQKHLNMVSLSQGFSSTGPSRCLACCCMLPPISLTPIIKI